MSMLQNQNYTFPYYTTIFCEILFWTFISDIFMYAYMYVLYKYVWKNIGYFYLSYNQQWKVRKSLRNNPQSEINEKTNRNCKRRQIKTVSIFTCNQLSNNFPSAGSLRSQAGGWRLCCNFYCLYGLCL